MTKRVDTTRNVCYSISTRNVKGVRQSVNTVDVGTKLRQLRGDRPAREVADALGISESALLMYERGERNPRDDIKIRIAHYYGVGVGDIFYPDHFTKCEV